MRHGGAISIREVSGLMLLCVVFLAAVNAQGSRRVPHVSTSSSAPRSPCARGRYGPGCQSTCSQNCATTNCNVINGNCEGGCVDGWHGDQCSDACPQGFYGSNCTMECSGNCLGDQCHPVEGICTKGCNPGWVGRSCANVCRQGYHGDGCRTRCSNNCATRECHHESGYCLKGCKMGFWGSDCSLFGDIQDVPEPMRARFYSKLSAESRSVLLFVLMGQYERTLETAQMEISRGIKQRNELKSLIDPK